MDYAKCTTDNTNYLAHVFADLSDVEIAQKRYKLECIKCKAPAFFRKKSTSGQAACFGAKPHNKGCPLSTIDNDLPIKGGSEGQVILDNPGTRIIVDLRIEDKERKSGEPIECENAPGRLGGRYQNEPKGNADMRRKLSSLLKTLINNEQFRYSEQVIEIGSKTKSTVKDFFVPFPEANLCKLEMIRGFWGKIKDANSASNGTRWLNSGSKEEVSICVPEKLVEPLKTRFKIKHKNDLSNSHALIIGRLLRSKKKMYIILKDLAFITILLKKPSISSK